VTFLVVLIGSIVGHWECRRALVVEVAIFAIGLVAVGIIQAVPHGAQIACRFDP